MFPLPGLENPLVQLVWVLEDEEEEEEEQSPSSSKQMEIASLEQIKEMCGEAVCSKVSDPGSNV